MTSGFGDGQLTWKNTTHCDAAARSYVTVGTATVGERTPQRAEWASWTT
ncbi:hypothetical protein [Gordonia iterans]